MKFSQSSSCSHALWASTLYLILPCFFLSALFSPKNLYAIEEKVAEKKCALSMAELLSKTAVKDSESAALVGWGSFIITENQTSSSLLEHNITGLKVRSVSSKTFSTEDQVSAAFPKNKFLTGLKVSVKPGSFASLLWYAPSQLAALIHTDSSSDIGDIVWILEDRSHRDEIEKRMMWNKGGLSVLNITSLDEPENRIQALSSYFDFLSKNNAEVINYQLGKNERLNLIIDTSTGEIGPFSLNPTLIVNQGSENVINYKSLMKFILEEGTSSSFFSKLLAKLSLKKKISLGAPLIKLPGSNRALNVWGNQYLIAQEESKQASSNKINTVQAYAAMLNSDVSFVQKPTISDISTPLYLVLYHTSSKTGLVLNMTDKINPNKTFAQIKFHLENGYGLSTKGPWKISIITGKQTNKETTLSDLLNSKIFSYNDNNVYTIQSLINDLRRHGFSNAVSLHHGFDENQGDESMHPIKNILLDLNTGTIGRFDEDEINKEEIYHHFSSSSSRPPSFSAYPSVLSR